MCLWGFTEEWRGSQLGRREEGERGRERISARLHFRRRCILLGEEDWKAYEVFIKVRNVNGDNWQQ